MSSQLETWKALLPPEVWHEIWHRGEQLRDRGYCLMLAYILSECEAYAKLYGLEREARDLSETKPRDAAIPREHCAAWLQGKEVHEAGVSGEAEG